jgi:hypothetical protein
MKRAVSGPSNAPEAGATDGLTGIRVVRARLFRVREGRRTTLTTRQQPIASSATGARPLRVAGMIALAFQIERMIDSGEMRDRAQVARAVGFSRARVTQLLDLTLLAPDLIEEIVFIEHERGIERVTERSPRRIVHAGSWDEQRRRWRTLREGRMSQSR